MKLKELEIGDKFYPKSTATKRTPIFKVIGKPVFNHGHGTSTRICLNLVNNEEVSKSCRLEVIKITPKR